MVIYIKYNITPEGEGYRTAIKALQWLKKIFKENYTVVILRVVNDCSAVVNYIRCQLDQPTNRPPTGSVTKQWSLSKKLHDQKSYQSKKRVERVNEWKLSVFWAWGFPATRAKTVACLWHYCLPCWMYLLNTSCKMVTCLKTSDYW